MVLIWGILDRWCFFPQSDLKMSEEKMCQHTSYHVMFPTRQLSYLIVIHTRFRFRFFTALFNSPTNAAKPYEGF